MTPDSRPAANSPARQTEGSWWAVAGVAALTLFTFVRPSTQRAEGGHGPGSGSAAPAPARPPGDTTPSRPVEDGQSAKLQPGRGRTAETPSQIPAKGWKDILWRVYGDLGTHRLLAVAAGVTFYALLAIFPAIAAFVSLYGLFADAGTISKQLGAMSGFMPGGAVDIIGEQVKRIASKPSGSLSFGLISGLAIALWSANAGMKAMFDALNVVYDETEKRSFIKLNAMSLAFTVGAIIILMLAIASVVVLPIVLNFVGLGSVAGSVLSLARWPLLLILILAGLAVLYRFGPSRDRAQWRWITWGSAIAAVAWIAASGLFSWYVSSFGNYNATYGSLGAAVGFMTWIWISSTIVLIGGEFNAEMELQTERDTTVGHPKPLGARGAKVADQVGKAAD